MRIMHVALGGCLKAPPVEYGLTEDTGGHIAYVLGAAQAQAARRDVAGVEIVTRGFHEPALGALYGQLVEEVAPGCVIRRLLTDNTAYLSKEALEAELPALTDAFLQMLRDAPRRPDVIHAHFADAAELAAAAEAEFGIPWIYTAHSLGLEKAACKDGGLAGSLGRRIEREGRAIGAAHAIVASSRDEAERQIAAYDRGAAGRTHRVNPGITISPARGTERARNLIAPFLRDMSKPVILAVARPIEKKNLVALVEAYGGDPELREQANLVIVAGLRDGLTGGGEEQDRVIAGLFDAVDRHDLWGQVALPRRHAPEDIPGFYALAAEGGVFCNPAWHEPFGLTLIEAAQSGVPLVATRSGGPVDILRSIGGGRLIDPADTDDIAHALRQSLGDELRDRRAALARRRAHEVFDWARWAERVQRICGEITTTTPASAAPASAMVVCDIDGTLTGDAGGAARFCDWARHRAGGQRFAVATGRSISEARRVLAEWALPRPDLMITSVGTEIWRWDGQGRLALCQDYAALIGRDWDREAVAGALSDLGVAAQAGYEQRPWKLSYFGSAAEAALIEDRLAGQGLAARVVASHGRFIDVMPRAAGKAAATRFEAARLGLPEEAIVVAGDSGNDADMLDAFARAVIPANGLDELAHLGGAYRSPYPHADGVLDGLARFGLALPPVRSIAGE